MNFLHKKRQEHPFAPPSIAAGVLASLHPSYSTVVEKKVAKEKVGKEPKKDFLLRSQREEEEGKDTSRKKKGG